MNEYRARTIAEELRKLNLRTEALEVLDGEWLVRLLLPGQDGRNALDIHEAAWTVTGPPSA